MKKVLFFVVFFIIGFIVTLGFVYLFGFLASKFGVALYESEYDQQRNFNIVFVLTFLCSLVSGIVGAKKYT
jgi:hypothetical protein